MRLQPTWTTRLKMTSLVILACIASIPAYASTFNFTYSNIGGLTAPPVQVGTTLHLSGLATGTVLSNDASLNAVWNPVSFITQDVLDLTTGLDNGTFTLDFANGNTLFGNLFEDDSQVTNTGPYTQILTILGGTGGFSGATGSASGGGFVGLENYTTVGKGTLTVPGVSPVPEPSTFALLGTGLLGAAGVVRRRMLRLAF